MYKRTLPALAIVFVCLLTVAGCGGVAGDAHNCNGGCAQPVLGDITAVNHVVMMLQENRSFDTYFGQMTAYRQRNNIPINSSDGKINDLSSGIFSNISPVGNVAVSPYHTGSVCTEDLTSAWAETHKAMDLENPSAASTTSPMDGFVNVAWGIAQYGLTLGITLADQAGRRPMGYFDDSDLNYYYYMASNFAMSDALFSPVPARTTENRLYLNAATSQGHAHEPVNELDAKTIWQELSENNISWKIYVTDKNDALNPPYYTYFEYFTYSTQPGVYAQHVFPLSQYFTDVQAGTLPAVSFIETGQFSGRDEHPSNFDPTNPSGLNPVNVQTGAAYVSTIINALMNSPSWKDSIFFWAMDEAGGAYDHVPPISVPNPDGKKPQDLIPAAPGQFADPTGDFTITGFRVPNFIVSPFAKKNYVSHTPMDYTAFLAFIEARWKLSPLTRRDAFMPSMTEFFDFRNGGPWATPPANVPTQNTDGVCDFTKQ